jgi:surface carbohydrate biosynthesis protein
MERSRLSSFRWLRAAREAIGALFRMRKKWSPRRARIAVLHDALVSFLEPLFDNEPYELVQLDGESVYLDPRIWLSTLRQTLQMPTLRPVYVRAAYALAVLERIKPAIVVTFTDNSAVFHIAAERFREARFLAIQNGGRLLDRDHPRGRMPQIYHREFACLGRYEIDQFSRHGARVEKYYPIGSLKDANYRQWRARRGAVGKEFDFCLPSQFHPATRQVYPERLNSFEVLTQHVRRFCESHGTSLCVPLRFHPDGNRAGYEWEREFFETRLGRLAQLFPNVVAEYTTYELVDRSRVSIGMHSTVLREGFGRGNRVLSCNYTGDPVYTFPIPGPWTLIDPSYDAFEQRLLWLLHASDEDYVRACGDLPSYLIAYDEELPTHVFLQRLIASAVRGAGEPAGNGVIVAAPYGVAANSLTGCDK